MNKISWFMAFLTIAIIITFTVESFYTGNVNVPVNPGHKVNNAADVFAVVGVFFSTYMKILFFQVAGLPVLFNILFLVMNGGMFYIIIDLFL